MVLKRGGGIGREDDVDMEREEQEVRRWERHLERGGGSGRGRSHLGWDALGVRL